MRFFFLPIFFFICSHSHGQNDIDIFIQDAEVGSTMSFSGAAMSAEGVYLSSYSGWSLGNPNTELIDYLANDHIRKQLEFSDAQTKEFKALQKEYSQAYKEMYAKFPELKRKDIPSEARKVLNQKVSLEGQKLRKEFSEKVRETLIPKQVSSLSSLRFKQMVQLYGFTHAVSNSPFVDELETTDKQKKELAKIRKESQEAIQKKIAEMKADAKAKMLKVFDAKQRKKLKEIEGPDAVTPKL